MTEQGLDYTCYREEPSDNGTELYQEGEDGRLSLGIHHVDGRDVILEDELRCALDEDVLVRGTVLQGMKDVSLQVYD